VSGRRIYMDNAATSFPKPLAVQQAMAHFATEIGASPGRGAYAEAREAGRLMHLCRQRINTLIHGEDPNHVIFTLNTTDGLNLAIRGIVHFARHANPRVKPHVITTWMDHNSILRPFNALAQWEEIEQSRIECDPATGLVDPQDIARAIRPETCLIAVVHGSNVTGTLQPVAEIGRIAREHDIPYLVDAAQTVGHVPLNVQHDCIDLLAFPGHKGLLGPLGTGALYIRPGIEKRMHTTREGGTGSLSEHDTQPPFMPDRFEPGSHNAIGIIGLSEGVQWILDKGVDSLWRHERSLISTMLESLDDEMGLPGLSLLGPRGVKHRCGVFAVRIDGFDHPQSLSDVLENEYGILTRSGIHCAPLAHQTIGTAALQGATRFSFGPFLSIQDVIYAGNALSQICQRHLTRTA